MLNMFYVISQKQHTHVEALFYIKGASTFSKARPVPTLYIGGTVGVNTSMIPIYSLTVGYMNLNYRLDRSSYFAIFP